MKQLIQHRSRKLFKLNDNNTKTRVFYETRILKAINIFNFQMKNKLKMTIQVPMKTTISKQNNTDWGNFLFIRAREVIFFLVKCVLHRFEIKRKAILEYWLFVFFIVGLLKAPGKGITISLDWIPDPVFQCNGNWDRTFVFTADDLFLFINKKKNMYTYFKYFLHFL